MILPRFPGHPTKPLGVPQTARVIDTRALSAGVFDWAVSMTKRKKRSMMLPEIKSVRSEQFGRTLEAQRLAWPGVQFPGNRIQFFLGEAAQVGSLGQVLPQQAVGVLVDATLPGLCGSAK